MRPVFEQLRSHLREKTTGLDFPVCRRGDRISFLKYPLVPHKAVLTFGPDFFRMAISFANRSNADLLDENHRLWRNDPGSVDATWAAFFEGFELGSIALKNGAGGTAAPKADAALQTRVDGLVYSYRTLGHTVAQLDPLAHERPENPLLSLRELGFSEKDFDLTISSKFFMGGTPMKTREMLDRKSVV